ncbi:MAG: hypothetical protein VZS44_00910 [Bacilli bacterium]|nr:hypothetical protein [Bacilli bacterium]
MLIKLSFKKILYSSNDTGEIETIAYNEKIDKFVVYMNYVSSSIDEA